MSKGTATRTVARTFEEGKLEGGDVLWAEPRESLEERERGRRGGWWVGNTVRAVLFVLVCADALLYLMIALAPSPRSAQAAVGLAPSFLMAVTFLYAFTVAEREIRAQGPPTPQVLYKNGISKGEGRRPFYPFSAVYAVEEVNGSRRGTPYLVIVFKGGESLEVTGGRVRDVWTFPGDHGVPKPALLASVPPSRTSTVEWTPAAEEMTVWLRALCLAARANLEQIATEEGAERIDVTFVKAHWRALRRELGPDKLVSWIEFDRQLRLARNMGMSTPKHEALSARPSQVP